MIPLILTFLTLSNELLIYEARLEQNRAIANGNREKAASFWTEDVTLRRGLGGLISGKEAYSAILDTCLTYVRTPDTIVVSSSWPLAYESGTWSAHQNDGPPLISGKYAAQWVERNGVWLIRSEVFVALEGSEEAKSWPAIP